MSGDELGLGAVVPRGIRKAAHDAIKANDDLFEDTADVLRKCVIEIHNLLGSTETYYVKNVPEPGLANDNPLLLGYEELLEIDSLLNKAEDIFLRTDHSLSFHNRLLKRLEKHLIEEHADREMLHTYLKKHIQYVRKHKQDKTLIDSIEHILVRIRERFLHFQAFSDWSNAELHELPESIEDLHGILSFNHGRMKEIEELHTYLKGALYDEAYNHDTFNHLSEFLPYHFTLKEERLLGSSQDVFNEKVTNMFAHYRELINHHKKIRHYKPKHRAGIDEDFEVDQKIRQHYSKKEFIHAIKELTKTHIKNHKFLNEKTFLRHLDILKDNYQYDMKQMLRVGNMMLKQLAEVHLKLQEFNKDVLDDSYGSYDAMLTRMHVLRAIHLEDLSIFSLGSLQGLVRKGLETFEDLRVREIAIFEEILEAERALEHLYTDKHKKLMHDTFLESFLHKVTH